MAASGKHVSVPATELLDSIADPVYLHDWQGRMLYVNRAAAAADGYTREELLGLTLAELDGPADAARIGERLRELRRSGMAMFTSTHRAKDGTVRPVEVHAHLLTAGNRNLIVSVARDISERMTALAALERANRILRTQQEVSPDGILVVDERGTVLSHNRRFAEMWGIPAAVLRTRADEQLLQAVHDRVAQPEAFLDRVRQLYAHPDEAATDEIVLRDGRVFERYTAPMRGDDGACLGRVWFFRDVTERRRSRLARDLSRQMLHDQQVALEQKNVDLRDLLAQLSLEKQEMHRATQAMLDKLLLPTLHRLRRKATTIEQRYLDIIEENLKVATKELHPRLKEALGRLSPREMEICSLIRNGYSGKEIAATLSLNAGTVQVHRNNIRRKLRLRKKGINLTTYLRQE